MTSPIPRIAVTTGEPAGIGPDIVLALAEQDWPAELVVFVDHELMTQRARALHSNIELVRFNPDDAARGSRRGELIVRDTKLAGDSVAGELDTSNAPAVIKMLDAAAQGCLDGQFAAMVTAPVHKGIINDAGIAFSGHTEFLAEKTGASQPVMLLVADSLRVALVTTHLPLRQVPDAISEPVVRRTYEILDSGLRSQFGIDKPTILVLGLNPHAGENGHLGREEIESIEPAVKTLRDSGHNAIGPLPADTALTPHHLDGADAVLAMFHDQGLPVLKNRGFGRAVNVTLGLPIIRTSVDHGTALDLAGTGQAEPGSLLAATKLAIDLIGRQQRA